MIRRRIVFITLQMHGMWGMRAGTVIPVPIPLRHIGGHGMSEFTGYFTVLLLAHSCV